MNGLKNVKISRDLALYLKTICRIYSHMVYWQEARDTYSWGSRQPRPRQEIQTQSPVIISEIIFKQDLDMKNL